METDPRLSPLAENVVGARTGLNNTSKYGPVGSASSVVAGIVNVPAFADTVQENSEPFRKLLSVGLAPSISMVGIAVVAGQVTVSPFVRVTVVTADELVHAGMEPIVKDAVNFPMSLPGPPVTV